MVGDGLSHRVVGQELHLDRVLGQRAGGDRTYGLAFTRPVPSDACRTLPRTGRRPGSSCSPPGRHVRDVAEASCAHFTNRFREDVRLLADGAGPSGRAAGSAISCHGFVPGVSGPVGERDRMLGSVPRAADR